MPCAQKQETKSKQIWNGLHGDQVINRDRVTWLAASDCGNRTLSISASSAMARTAIETFLITIFLWLESDFPRRGELLDKVEGMSDCLAKIIRHIGFSSITEHLTTVWILSRRALCVMRGIPVENTANITIASIGSTCQRPRGYRALRELNKT